MSDNGHYAYYPGCSQTASAKAYDVSAKYVMQRLGLETRDVEDWNCCGATEYFSLNALPAYSLVARNLALAAQQNTHELVAPCSACYLNLRKTEDKMAHYPKLNKQVNQALAAGGLSYEPGALRVRHILDVLIEDVGLEAIKDKVTKPLAGLRVAPYYGCMLARPYNDSYNPEYPTRLDHILEALGATVIDFPLKTHCCGGHMTQISEETAFELIRRILQNAADYEADLIAAICPMCQLNLDVFQPQTNTMFQTNFHMPVLFFTQLMGLAYGGTEDEMGIGSERISARDALRKIGQEKAPEKKRPKKRDKQALPMPPMD